MNPATDSTAGPATARPSTRCCPLPDAAPWEGRELVWRDRLFVKQRVRCVLHVPLNMAAKVLQAGALIARADAAAPGRTPMLVEQRSAWAADVYIEVTKAVPGADMATLSGTFLTKVFEGPYRDAPRWVAAMTAYVTGRGRTLSRLFFGYTLCPACARAYGQNPVVMFAQVDAASA